MKRTFALLTAVAAVLAMSSAASAISSSFYVGDKISGDSSDILVKITLDDAASPGDIKVTAEVVTNGSNPNTGDLRGIFFHVANESLLGGMSATGADVSADVFNANSVLSVGSPSNNLNGGGGNNPGPFDGGVEIGSQGIGTDDIQMTMFFLSHTSVNLDLSLFLDPPQWFGVRVMSVGTPGGSRGGSSKMKGMPGEDPIPEPVTAGLAVLGLGAIGFATRRRRSA